jgi:3-hydroxyisobutyrate dehydrogenase-like beta-hydroxyacid dehydrogenase
MKIALAGVGRMGAAIAERLRAAGYELSLFDVAPQPGVPSAPSLEVAAGGADLVFLCLPDAAAVESSVPALLQARPPVCVDLTSSVPSVTRRVGEVLEAGGVAFMDCPLSGGVQGARDGRLTAMAGGDPDLLDRVRPVLAAFASNVVWAGGLGAGDAVKAVNNALSAVSLTATSEMLVLAVACGVREADAVDRFNAGGARSQNSEVKFPRDVLSRSYAAGFTAGLMEKDFATAIEIAQELSVPIPFTAAALAVWREVAAEIGPGGDFTRVHAVVATRSSGGPRRAASLAGFSIDVLEWSLASVNLIAAREMLRVLDTEGLDRARALAIINASSGRSEATRGRPGEVDHGSLRLAAELAERVAVWAPLTALGAGGVGSLHRGGLDRAPSKDQRSPINRQPS